MSYKKESAFKLFVSNVSGEVPPDSMLQEGRYFLNMADKILRQTVLDPTTRELKSEITLQGSLSIADALTATVPTMLLAHVASGVDLTGEDDTVVAAADFTPVITTKKPIFGYVEDSDGNSLDAQVSFVKNGDVYDASIYVTDSYVGAKITVICVR